MQNQLKYKIIQLQFIAKTLLLRNAMIGFPVSRFGVRVHL